MKSNFLLTVPEATSRYKLGNLLGQGVFGAVYNAIDTEASMKKVAIKIQKYDKDFKDLIEEEYEILKEMSSCIYLIDFYGIFKKDNEIWFILENCQGNSVLDLVKGLQRKNRCLSEEHIGYILKELVKALIYLHENTIVHRDVKASNILITKNGEIKLCDFGLAKKLKAVEEKLFECIGSSCWMAPEVVKANYKDLEKGFYDNRVDVWSLGITALEIGEGNAPYYNMHPSRILFEIVKNPPPTFEKVSRWSEHFHDFVSECLVKNFDHRPYIMEIIEHPFLQDIPENNYHLSLEIQTLTEEISSTTMKQKINETIIIGKYMKTSIEGQPERIIEEDLSDLDHINEKTVMALLEKRFNNKEFYTFAGDILLSINPNEQLDFFGKEYHKKYIQKSRSENLPHIYAIADTVYQNALHHNVPQQIVFTGESASGKTTNYLHIIDHLFFIGEQHPVSAFKIKNAIKLIHSLTHASTPTNDYSTRCVFKTNLAFGKSGKLTGAEFRVLFLEKWRISSVDMNQCNFHILYYIYDGLVRHDAIKKYRLHNKRDYRYLRISNKKQSYDTRKPRDNIDQNIIKYKKIFSYLEEFEFSEEQITTFFSIIGAILNLGEIRFSENSEIDDNSARLENKDAAINFADLMEINYKKFIWALTNYCIVKQGNAIKKKNTCDEARDSRDVLANNLYNRFVDYILAIINDKLEIGKAIFGSKYSIHLLDYFGFECFKENHLPEFFINTLNEQLQYHYLQRIFSWEYQDLHSEEMEFKIINVFDNKKTLNQLLTKPEGVLSIIDDVAKSNLNGKHIMNNIEKQETNRVLITKPMEFSIAHYTGIVSYNAKEIPNKNRDFLPAELIETLRESENPIIRLLFANKLDKTGGLIVNFRKTRKGVVQRKIADENQFSQTQNMRTCGMIFRNVSLELLKELSIGGGSAGTHFVRCLRSDLKGKPQNFNRELIKQQIRALAVVETAKIRQEGFSYRVSFSEFIRRYQFLAFDFEETVDISKENCRLLLIRLKMEGWAIGKSMVFLKYYNEEFLSRFYESHVRKIIKMQSIMRGFLAKCRLNKENRKSTSTIKPNTKDTPNNKRQQRRRSSVLTPDEAAEIIQKAYRKSTVKRKSIADIYDPIMDKHIAFIRPYARKWKNKSIFQVLMLYRSVKFQEFFNLSQQVHFYNQNTFFNLQKIQPLSDLDKIDRKAQSNTWLGEINKARGLKVKFKLDEIPFFDTSALCDPLTNVKGGLRDDSWDSPYRWRSRETDVEKIELKSDLIAIPFNRECEEFMGVLPSKILAEEKTSKIVKFNKNDEYCAKPQDRYSGMQLKNVDKVGKSEKSTINEDFTFKNKSPQINIKSRSVDPLAELRSISRKQENSSKDDDDPPYNFQGMLRKTNYQPDIYTKPVENRRGSLKNALNTVRKFSLPKIRDDSADEIEDDEDIVVKNSRPVFMELVPGLILEGIEVDL